MSRLYPAFAAALLLLPLLLLASSLPRAQASTQEEFDPFHEGQDLCVTTHFPDSNLPNRLAHTPLRYCSACRHVAATFNELASAQFKKTLSAEKKMKVAEKVLADVCAKSGIDSVSGSTGQRKFVNFMKMQQASGTRLALRHPSLIRPPPCLTRRAGGQHELR